MSRLLLTAALLVASTGCLSGESLPNVEPGECPAVGIRVLPVQSGTYSDTGIIEPPLLPGGGAASDDTDYRLEISEDRTRVIETFRRGGMLYRVEYEAQVETRRR